MDNHIPFHLRELYEEEQLKFEKQTKTNSEYDNDRMGRKRNSCCLQKRKP